LTPIFSFVIFDSDLIFLTAKKMKSLLKKTFAPVSGAVTMVLFSVNNVFAGGAFFQKGTAPAVATQEELGQSITTIINYFLGLLGLVAVAFLIYAGILMVTAGGNDEQVTKARKIIMYAVVGIVIILLSYTIVTFVSQAFG
jgi:cytochrome bd-type quinol oxidase subunit 2